MFMQKSSIKSRMKSNLNIDHIIEEQFISKVRLFNLNVGDLAFYVIFESVV
jgi:hypothetical protein